MKLRIDTLTFKKLLCSEDWGNLSLYSTFNNYSNHFYRCVWLESIQQISRCLEYGNTLNFKLIEEISLGSKNATQ